MEVTGACGRVDGTGQCLRWYGAVFVKQSKWLVRQFGIVRQFGVVRKYRIDRQHRLLGFDGQQRLQRQFRVGRFIWQQRIQRVHRQQRFCGWLGIDGESWDRRWYVGWLSGDRGRVCRRSANRVSGRVPRCWR